MCGGSQICVSALTTEPCLQHPQSFLFKDLFYAYECLSACTNVHGVPTQARRGHQILETGVTDVYESPYGGGGLGIKAR